MGGIGCGQAHTIELYDVLPPILKNSNLEIESLPTPEEFPKEEPTPWLGPDGPITCKPVYGWRRCPGTENDFTNNGNFYAALQQMSAWDLRSRLALRGLSGEFEDDDGNHWPPNTYSDDMDYSDEDNSMRDSDENDSEDKSDSDDDSMPELEDMDNKDGNGDDEMPDLIPI